MRLFPMSAAVDVTHTHRKFDATMFDRIKMSHRLCKQWPQHGAHRNPIWQQKQLVEGHKMYKISKRIKCTYCMRYSSVFVCSVGGTPVERKSMRPSERAFEKQYRGKTRQNPKAIVIKVKKSWLKTVEKKQ